MGRSEIQAKLSEVLGRVLHLEPEEIDLDASLEDGLGADSLGMVEVLLALEDAFGIEFTDDEAARIVVGRDLLDLVAARLGA